MAKDKKAFVLYTDLEAVLEKLIQKDRENKTNNAGELFYHILKYVNDENPEPINFIIEMTFEPIKLQLKRDLIKYEQKREKNKQNANMRWNNVNASGNQKMQFNANACDGTNRNANDAVIDIDNDIDIHSTSVNARTCEGNTVFYDRLKNDQLKLEQCCMQLHISMEEILNQLNNFQKEVTIKDTIHKDYRDYNSHFYDWLRIQIEKTKNQGSKSEKKTGAAAIISETVYTNF